GRLEKAEPTFQVELLAALGSIGAGASNALPQMSPMAGASSASVRTGYALAVSRMKKAVAPSSPQLPVGTQDKDPAVRGSSLAALAAVDPENAGTIEGATKGLDDPEI